MTIGKLYAAKLIWKNYREHTKGPRIPAVRIGFINSLKFSLLVFVKIYFLDTYS